MISKKPRPREAWEILRDPYATYLAHAIRLWEAEEENSRRIGRRVGLLITASFGFFGIALLRFGIASFDMPAIRADVAWSLWTALVLLTIGAVSLAASTLLLFDVLRCRRRVKPASDRLRLEQKDLRGFRAQLEYHLESDAESHRRYSEIANEQLLRQSDAYYSAVTELSVRNAREKQRIDRAQWLFLPGVLLIMLALLFWVYTRAAGVPHAPAAVTVREETTSAAEREATTGRPPGETGAGLGPDEPGGARGADGGNLEGPPSSNESERTASEAADGSGR